jgi:diguanylate cyclase (GGDEF)-like protein
MSLQHIILLLCSILIALLFFTLIFGWEIHIATTLLIVLCVALGLSLLIYVLLNYKRSKRKQQEIGYKTLQHLYQQSTLLNEVLRQQSLSDPLTGLYNRRFFMSALANEIARAKRRNYQISVVIMDIDHFKQYNDTFGHEAGDQILQKLAGILRKHFRESDIICRYGGEEFIVFLSEIGLKDAKRRCEKLLELIREELLLPALPKARKVTVSIGIAVFPKHGRSAKQLINKADKALYEAKSNGRNQIKVFEE